MAISRSFLPIDCLDKQASASRERKKGETTTKPFSKTAHTCYAPGGHKKDKLQGTSRLFQTNSQTGFHICLQTFTPTIGANLSSSLALGAEDLQASLAMENRNLKPTNLVKPICNGSNREPPTNPLGEKLFL
ncbi:hypothetical protein TNCV_1170291 [Trichonephila clavipes]|nr:hypothetical protein TNCV_1170291 [Trichonephila clavipes]